ncbi:hypothetical protein OG992_31685 [Micromonospora sp. NBC_00362]|uniref:hypothetical protein n=1 Tax=Micromonospora sp. NBC_00362 TaxID=2975975 RepID=UPI002252DAEF|nr:hypothetical protein [Micromonospora sp. NBC_00362]MCX5121744.1 hypothetical protein [Micromonospora sp. NBC_00362]
MTITQPTAKDQCGRWRAVTFVLGPLLGGVGALLARPVLGEWGSATIGDIMAVAAYLALVSVLAGWAAAALLLGRAALRRRDA